MSGKLNGLHEEILSEFEQRIDDDDDIPDVVTSALREEDELGLESADTIKSIIDETPNATE